MFISICNRLTGGLGSFGPPDDRHRSPASGNSNPAIQRLARSSAHLAPSHPRRSTRRRRSLHVYASIHCRSNPVNLPIYSWTIRFQNRKLALVSSNSTTQNNLLTSRNFQELRCYDFLEPLLQVSSKPILTTEARHFFIKIWIELQVKWTATRWSVKSDTSTLSVS